MHNLEIFLYHYYETSLGPFRNLSDLDHETAETILQQIREQGTGFAAHRAPNYLTIRRLLEQRMYELFLQKDGQPERAAPHYMIVEPCPWLQQWYHQGDILKLPLQLFPAKVISFTYGDSFPAMLLLDRKPHRGQVYTLAELPDLITAYGLPQDWNKEGTQSPDRYIEAQIWSDEPLRAFYPFLSFTS